MNKIQDEIYGVNPLSMRYAVPVNVGVWPRLVIVNVHVVFADARI